MVGRFTGIAPIFKTKKAVEAELGELRCAMHDNAPNSGARPMPWAAVSSWVVEPAGYGKFRARAGERGRFTWEITFTPV
jgi:hypothetical protein